jgi:hypothetical protein
MIERRFSEKYRNFATQKWRAGMARHKDKKDLPI